MKLDRCDYVGDITPHANFRISIPKWGGSAHAWSCHRPCLFFLHPVTFWFLDRFSCFMAQKTCFCDSYVLFGVRTNFFNNFYYFSQKMRNSLFPQCKTSIGNNSGSIKDRVAKFAYSIWFSTTADRMVWPPSLSRDRKWPRPSIRRKTTLSMHVTPVAYKLEQSVMGQKMCFCDIYVLFGVRTKNLIISTIFRKKREIPYSRNVKLQSAITPVL